METAFPPEQEVDTLSAYLGAIDDLFTQHTNAEITGDIFVSQAAIIVSDFETNETQQEQFQIFSQQLRSIVAMMSCCSSETASAFQASNFFNLAEQEHQLCEDDHKAHHEGDRKKKKDSSFASAFLLKQTVSSQPKKRFFLTSSK